MNMRRDRLDVISKRRIESIGKKRLRKSSEGGSKINYCEAITNKIN
jgi:hypothetical protein